MAQYFGDKRRRNRILRAALGALIAFGPVSDAFAAPKPRPNPSRQGDDDMVTAAITPVSKPESVQRASAAAPANDLLTSLSPSQLGLEAALKLIDDGQVGKAAAIGRMMPDQTNRHIIQWLVAQSGSPDVTVTEITQTAQELADWPGQSMLRRRAEQALKRMNADPQTIISAFSGTDPGSSEGLILLTGALVQAGKTKEAAALLRPRWRKDSFSDANEQQILQQFGNLLTPADHKARMDKFFYDDDATEGLAVSKLLDADTRQLAAARAAVIRRDKNAAALLTKVPGRLQKDPGYLYSKTQFLRRAERYQDAAKVMLQAPREPSKLVDPDAWWIERRVLSRELLDLGDPRTAYKLVAEHAAESSSNQADAEFHAGWYALRFLNDPATARRHFAAIPGGVDHAAQPVARRVLARPLRRGDGRQGRGGRAVPSRRRLSDHLLRPARRCQARHEAARPVEAPRGGWRDEEALRQPRDGPGDPALLGGRL